MQENLVITDGQLQEITAHGTKEFPIKYYLDDLTRPGGRRVNPHWHRETEFFVVHRGAVECQMGGETLSIRQGEGIFINTRVIHGFEAREKTIVPNVVFSPQLVSGLNYLVYQKYIEPILISRISHLKLSPRVDWQREILQTLEEVFRLFGADSETREIDIQLAVTSIWRILFLHRESCAAPPQTSGSLTIQSRLRLMLGFVGERYPERISLFDIASAANVSKNEALRCFREGAGISPVDYLIQLRLNKARELLLTTDKTVTDISSSVGFEAVGYFDRMFKRSFGITPKEMRRQASGRP